jgi:hypothetical protein
MEDVLRTIWQLLEVFLGLNKPTSRACVTKLSFRVAVLMSCGPNGNDLRTNRDRLWTKFASTDR